MSGNFLPPFLVRFAHKFAQDIVKNLQLIHSNNLNYELYSEPSFPAPQLYLLRHTLRSVWFALRCLTLSAVNSYLWSATKRNTLMTLKCFYKHFSLHFVLTWQVCRRDGKLFYHSLITSHLNMIRSWSYVGLQIHINIHKMSKDIHKLIFVQ